MIIETESKLIKACNILLIIETLGIFVGGIFLGWSESYYYNSFWGIVNSGHDWTIFLAYWGGSIVVAVVNWIVGKVICEFLNNVNRIAQKVDKIDTND